MIAATTCAAVEVSAPVLFVASETVIALPATLTLSGAPATPGSLNSAETHVAAVLPESLDVSTTAAACAVAAVPVTGWILNVKSPRSPW